MSDFDVNIGDKVVIDRQSSPPGFESSPLPSKRKREDDAEYDRMMAVAEYSIVDDCCQRLGYALITTNNYGNRIQHGCNYL